MPSATASSYELNLTVTTHEAEPRVTKLGVSATKTGQAFDFAATKATRAGSATASYGNTATKVDRSVSAAARSTDTLSAASTRLTSSFAAVVKRGLAVAATVLSIGAAMGEVRGATKTFGEVETGLVAITKTTGITGDALAELDRDISDLSVGDLPLLKTELLEIGAVAGQLGVQGSENILTYVETIGKLQVASDLAGEEGAKSLTRILNVQGEGPEQVERLASVIVALGNDAAASEREITRMATEVALATAQFRVGSTVAAAFGTAMVESGIRAELGGSVIGRTLRAIQSAAAEGGEELASFARIAGVSAQDFAAAWERDPIEALNIFLEGLGTFGQDASLALEEVGLKGEEVNKVLPTLAVNFATLKLRQRQAADEARELVALDREATAGLATQDKQLQRTQNAYKLLSELLGEGVSPALQEVSEEMRKWLLTNREAAKELGQKLGGALRRAADLFRVLADHAGILLVALGAFATSKLLVWLVGLGSSLVKRVVQWGHYTTATRAAAIANLENTRATAGMIPIYGAQGQVVSAVTRSTAGAAAATGAATAATWSFSAAVRGLTGSMAANPVGLIVVGLTLLLTTLGSVFGAVSRARAETEAYHEELRTGRPAVEGAAAAHDGYVDTLERETELVQKLREESGTLERRIAQLEPVAERMREALEVGDVGGYREIAGEAERLGIAFSKLGERSAFGAVTERLELLRDRIRANETQSIASAEAIESAQRSLADSVEKRLEVEALRLLKQRALLEDTRTTAEELREALAAAGREDGLGKVANLAGQLAEALRRSTSAAEGLTRFEARLENLAGDLGKLINEQILSGDIEGVDRILKLVESIQVDRNTSLLDELFPGRTREELLAIAEGYVHVRRKTEEAREEAKRFGESLSEQKDRLTSLKGSLQTEAAALDRLAAAALRGEEAFSEAQRSAEIERRFRAERAQLADLEGEKLDELRQSIASVVDAEKHLEGSKAVAALQSRVSAAERLIEAQEGTRADVLETQAALKLEAEVHEQVAGATDEHRAALERLTRTASRSEALAAAGADLQDLGKRVRETQSLAEAFRESTAAGEQLTRQLEIERQVHESTAPLLAQGALLRQELAAREQELALIEGGFLVVSDKRIDQLESEIAVGKEQLRLTEDQISAFRRLAAEEAASKAELARARGLASLKEEVAHLEALAAVKREDFATEEAFQKAIQAVNVEREVRLALLQLEQHREIALLAIHAQTNLSEQERLEKVRALNDELAIQADRMKELIRRRSELANAPSGPGPSGSLAGLQAAGGFFGGSQGSALRDFASTLQELRQVRKVVKEGGEELAALGGKAGAMGVAAAGAASSAVGLADSFGLLSDKQRQLSQQLGQLGSTVGGLVAGPVGASIGGAVGQVLGVILGAFDSAKKSFGDFEVESGRLVPRIHESANTLRGATQEAMDAIAAGINQAADLLGGELLSAGIGFQIFKGKGDPVFKVWVNHVKREFDTVEAAIQDAIVRGIQSAEIGGLSPIARAALENFAGSTVEELERTIALALEVERLGIPEAERDLHDELTRIVALFERAAEELGAVGGDLVLGSLLSTLQQSRDAALGIQRSQEEIIDEQISAWNAQRAAIEAQLLALRAELEARKADIESRKTLVRVNVLGAEGLLVSADLVGRAFGSMTEAAGGFASAAGATSQAYAEALAQIEAALAQIDVALGQLPDPISDDERKGAKRRARGDQDRAERERRQADRADVLRRLEDLRLLTGGLSQGALDLKRSFEDFDEWIESARELGIAEEALVRARRENVDLLTQDFLAPFQEIVQSAGETDLETSFRHLGNRFQEALQEAFVIAEERAAAFGTTLEEEFAPLKDVILEAFGVESLDLLRGEFDRLVEAGDLEGLRRLQEFVDSFASTLPPDLAQAFQDVLGPISQELADAITKLESQPVQVDLDLSKIQADLDFADQLTEAQVQLREISETYTEAIRKAIEQGAAEEDLARIRGGHAAAIDRVREAILDSVREYTDAVQGIGEFERRLSDLRERFSEARTGLDAADETRRKDLSGEDPEAATDEVGSLSVAVEKLRQGASDLVEKIKAVRSETSELTQDMDLLARAERHATRLLGVDFLGSLEDLGVSLPTELVLELARAQFHLAHAEAVSSALALAAAGAFDGLSISLDDVLQLLAEADFSAGNFAPQFGVPPVVNAGPAGRRSADAAIQDAQRIREELEAQIRAWNLLEFGSLTLEAIELRRRLGELDAEAARLRISTEELRESYRRAVRSFVNDSLREFERFGESPLQRELDDLLDRFRDLSAAFEVAGAGVEDVARLQAALDAALTDFLARATSGIRQLLEELQASDPRRTTEQRFLEAQSGFRDLLARAQGGDLDAIEQLEAAARTFRTEALAFLGEGVGSLSVLDEILAGLDSIGDVELVPENLRLLEEQRARLEELVAITTLQPTESGNTGGFSQVQGAIQQNRSVLEDNQRKLTKILRELRAGTFRVHDIDAVLSTLDTIASDAEALPGAVDDVLQALSGVLNVSDDLSVESLDKVFSVLGGVLTVADQLGPTQWTTLLSILGTLTSIDTLTDQQKTDLVGMLSSLDGLESLTTQQRDKIQMLLTELQSGNRDNVGGLDDILGELKGLKPAIAANLTDVPAAEQPTQARQPQDVTRLRPAGSDGAAAQPLQGSPRATAASPLASQSRPVLQEREREGASRPLAEQLSNPEVRKALLELVAQGRQRERADERDRQIQRNRSAAEIEQRERIADAAERNVDEVVRLRRQVQKDRPLAGGSA